MGRSDGIQPASDGGEFRLRILATSDLHAHLMPYDYTWDQPMETAGLARTASLIRAARTEAANSLLFDNGDFLHGSPLGEFAASGGRAVTCPHPVVAAMNTLGYDAAALGNHEFSHGLAFLEQAVAAADFPVLCANAVRRLGPTPTDDQAFLPPALAFDRRLTGEAGQQADIRIGVIGLLPPQVTMWEGKLLSDRIRTRDIVETARAWVPWLKARGADLVVALCHSGIGPETASDGMENAAVPLARVDGIDAIVAGHVHLPFPGPEVAASPGVDPVGGTLAGKPAVMAGFWGSHLGVIDLTLGRAGSGWRILAQSASTRSVARRQPDGRLLPLVANDPQVEAAAATAHAATLAHVRRPIGRADAPMHSYFARLADCAALQLVHAAQLGWLDEWARGTAYETLPRLSAASPFKSGGRGGPQYFTDVPAGDLALRNVSDLYVFPNAIRAVAVDGRTLREWLERSAAQYLQLTPSVADQPLFDPDAASYNFDTIAGVTYEIDLSPPSRYDVHGDMRNPGASRIRNLRHAGRPVAPDTRFLVVTNSFRAAGGGQFPGLDGSATVAEPLTLTADVIRAHIANLGELAPRARHNWRLAALPSGTGAWFDTGPRAEAHLGEDTGLSMEPAGETAAGFLRCRLLF